MNKTLKDRNAIMLTALDDGYSQIAMSAKRIAGLQLFFIGWFL